jgi:hypothetical protein
MKKPSIGDRVWFYYKGKLMFGNLVRTAGGYYDVQPEGCWFLVELLDSEMHFFSKCNLSKRKLTNWKTMVCKNYKTRLKYNII